MKKNAISVLLAAIIAIAPLGNINVSGSSVGLLTQAYAAQSPTTFDNSIIFKDTAAFDAELKKFNDVLLVEFKQASENINTNEDVLNWVKIYDECKYAINDLIMYPNSYMYIDVKNDSMYDKYNAAIDAANGFSTILNTASISFQKNGSEFLEGLLSDEELTPWSNLIVSVAGSNVDEGYDTFAYLIRPAQEVQNMIYNQYMSFRDNDLRYDVVEAPDGRLIPSNYTNYAESFSVYDDDEYAEKVDEAFQNTLNTYSNTFAGYLNSFIYLSESLAQRYGYSSALEQNLSSDGMEEEDFINFLDGALEGRKELKKVIEDTRKQKKEDKTKKDGHKVILDVSTPNTYSYDEAREIIVAALAPLGDEYIQTLNAIFDGGWVDAYSAEGKAADNVTLYGNNPVIIINYNGSYDSVSMLAHEMGHAVHLALSNKYQVSGYDKFPGELTSEVASLTNEILLARYMQENAKTDEERLQYFESEYRIIGNNFFAGAIESEFEYNIHNIVKDGGTLTAEVIKSEYSAACEKFLTTADDLGGDMFWAVVSQYYMPYYTKGYALSAVAAANIADKIYKGDTQATNDYLEFLKSGCSIGTMGLYELIGSDIKSDSFERPLIDRCAELLKEIL